MVESDLILKLGQSIATLEHSIEVSKANRVQLEELTKKKADIAKRMNIAVKCGTGLQRQITAINDYLHEKKKKGMQSIYSAIYASKSVIPHGKDLDLIIQTNGGAYIGNNLTVDVNDEQGGGFRALLAMFMRDRIVEASSDILQYILLDEPISTLDLESSAAVSAYLPILAKKKTILLIEQKPEVFVSSPHIVYHFELDNGVSKIRKEVVQGDNRD